MSRIVIDARVYVSSTGRYISRLIQELEQIDFENKYLILLNPEDFDAWQPTNPNFKKILCPYKEYTFAEQLGLKSQLKHLGADLVHFGMVQQPVFYRGKTVTTMNDLTTLRFNNPSKNRLVFWYKQRVYGWVNRRVAHKADALITYSGFVKNDVVSYANIDPDKITVIPLASDKILATPEPIQDLAERRYLLYVGRPMPHKNLERLIEAFVSLQKEHPGLRLVLGGRQDANYQGIEAGVNRRGLKDIVFTGYLNEGQLRWLYENCAAYVFPSLSEGFGLPGLEAMAHGAPVVSSNATCLPEVYGDAARYFDPRDVAAMAGAISEVLSDQKLRQTLVAKGQKRVKKYSWRRMAEQTLEVYRQVVNS